jgi:hypothetical protein
VRRSRRIRLIGSLALALALVAGCAGGAERGTQPRVLEAEAFLDSVGVQLHVSYYDTAYGRYDEWVARLRELGVRHVRDGVPGDDALALERLRRLGTAGLRITLGAPLDGDPAAAAAAAAGPLHGTVDAIEGPNEPEIFGGPGWEARLRGYVPALRAAARRADPALPLLGPSFVPPADGVRFTPIAKGWDVHNVHPYPGGQPPEGGLRDGFMTSRVAAPGKPVQATETGYHNALRHADDRQQPPVSEAAAGIYMPRLLAAAFADGYARVFIYELLDEKPEPGLADPEQHFGLLRADLTPKPAFDAVRKLLRVVRESPGEGGRRPVRVDGDVERLLLERPDGSRVLLLWRAEPVWDAQARRGVAVAGVPARLEFPQAVRDISVTRPSAASEAARRLDRVDSLRLEVGAGVTAVSWR